MSAALFPGVTAWTVAQLVVVAVVAVVAAMSVWGIAEEKPRQARALGLAFVLLFGFSAAFPLSDFMEPTGDLQRVLTRMIDVTQTDLDRRLDEPSNFDQAAKDWAKTKARLERAHASKKELAVAKASQREAERVALQLDEGSQRILDTENGFSQSLTSQLQATQSQHTSTRWAITGILIAIGIAAWGAWLSYLDGKKSQVQLTELKLKIEALPESLGQPLAPRSSPLARFVRWLSSKRAH